MVNARAVACWCLSRPLSGDLHVPHRLGCATVSGVPHPVRIALGGSRHAGGAVAPIGEIRDSSTGFSRRRSGYAALVRRLGRAILLDLRTFPSASWTKTVAGDNPR